MKKIIAAVFILSCLRGSAQAPQVEIDTLKVNFKIKGLIDVTSSIPQIKSGVNPIAKEKINADLKRYFKASATEVDSITYVKQLLDESGIKTLEEYFVMQQQILQDDPSYYEPQGEESFSIEYYSADILNVSYSYQILPYRGQYQRFFKSLIYDLRTGNKLRFDDFFTIDADKLIALIRKYGYTLESQNTPDVPFKIMPVDANDGYVAQNIPDLFASDTVQDQGCAQFYFTTHRPKQLMLKFLCAGPALGNYGISLEYLTPYIKHSDFRHWGKNINSLKGRDYRELGGEVVFDEYTLLNPRGGRMLSDEKITSANRFGIVELYSAASIFYLLTEYKMIRNISRAVIVDFLEISKTTFGINTIITEYCETKKGSDAEIFALVSTQGNPEYYTKIVKAWRANRKTKKFEVINSKKVRRCGNENYGL